MLSSHLILCHPLLLLPSIFPSIRVFSNESALHIRWPKYWSFSFSISPSNEYSGLISFKIDWFDLLAVQRALKSLLQHHDLKVFIQMYVSRNLLIIFLCCPICCNIICLVSYDFLYFCGNVSFFHLQFYLLESSFSCLIDLSILFTYSKNLVSYHLLLFSYFLFYLFLHDLYYFLTSTNFELNLFLFFQFFEV